MDTLIMEFCTLCLEVAEQVILRVSSDFDSASEEKQEELTDTCHLVLEYVVLLETFREDFHELVSVLTTLIIAMTARKSSLPIARGRGRPRLSVEIDRLRFLLETGFRVKDIADLLDCSKSTIERRMRDEQLGVYTSITDTALDDVIREITSSHPFCGQKTISGRLRSMNIHVQRSRVRESMCRVDPYGIETRKRRLLHRRVYHVESPNALWHLDGYHKLIRWKFVIHGAIDGFSRLVTFLKVSPNNLASTVLKGFKSAVDEFGLPLRIRIDRGGENTLVTQHMLGHPLRVDQPRTVIVGRSVHNQRIERLWRDLYTGCISFYYCLFYFLEDVGVLNVEDEYDLYALHFVCLPHIQLRLDHFREGWANHSLRTEHNHTPLQLWITGLHSLHASNPDHTTLDGFEVKLHVHHKH
jgi:transposase InsO family protein